MRLLTVQTLAELFSRHPNTIYQWIKEGLFPHAFKVKDGWYVPATDIHRLARGGGEKERRARLDQVAV